MPQWRGIIQIDYPDAMVEIAFRVTLKDGCRPYNFPGSRKPTPKRSPSHLQQETLFEDRRGNPPAGQAGDTLPAEGRFMPNEVRNEDRKPPLKGRAVALMASASVAMSVAIGGIAFVVGQPVDRALMVGMLSVVVFSNVIAIYKDMRKQP
jgi:hypothetical protein